MTGHGNTAGNPDTAKEKDKNRHRYFGTHTAGFNQKINHRQRTDGIGHVIGALGQGHIAGCADLDPPEDLLRACVVLSVSEETRKAAHRTHDIRVIVPARGDIAAVEPDDGVVAGTTVDGVIARTAVEPARRGGLVIALAAESWWSEREERLREGDIREDMLAEFAANIRILGSDVEVNEDLASNLAAAAHLIHGSSEGRFTVTYCPGKGAANLTRQDIESVGFGYADFDEMTAKYDPETLVDGFNTLPDGEEVFYISNPALGLWAFRDRFDYR